MTNPVLHPRDLAIVVYSDFPYATGGRETWLAHMLPALAGAGYRPTVYARAPVDEAIPPRFNVSESVTVRPIRRGRPWPPKLRKALVNAPVAFEIGSFVRRAKQELEADGFAGGVVLGLGPIIDVMPGVWLRRTDRATRVICAVHGRVAQELGHSLPWARPVLGRLERWSLRKSDAVLVNGEDTHEWLAGYGIASAVVPNGIEVADFAGRTTEPPAPIAAAQARGEAVLVMVATLREIKGIRPFIEALPLLRRRYGPGFRAFFLGKGDSAPYRAHAARHGVADLVDFVGEVPDIVPWLHASTVSVNLSGGAGMAIAALEALAAGTPVVAWDSPIYSQLIEPSVTGLLVPDGDVTALALALDRLLRDAALRASLAESGQALAREFDWSASAERLIAAVDRVYESPPR